MRILHVISGLIPASGGPATVVMNLAPAQARAGLAVSVVATYAPGDTMVLPDRLREQGIPVHMIGPCGGWRFTCPQLVPTLDELIAASDIVHIHSVWEEIQHQAARLARQRGIPYVMTPHGMLSPWSLSNGWLKKRLYLLWRMRRNLNHAARIHFTTEIERDLVGRLGLKAPPLVEALGLDLREFETLPPRGEFRRRHPELGGRRYIIFLGRISPQKGLETLIPALARLDLPDVDLIIVGPDSRGHQQVIQRLVAANGLTDRVHFTGLLEGADRLAALVDAQLLVAPSLHENFGLVVIEALACGVPVIVSDQVNLHPEITRAQVGGVVPVDVSALAGELRRWLADPARRADAAARAAAFVRSRYDIDPIAQRWVQHYRDVRPC